MKHTVIRCKSETLPNTVYFDPAVDYLESINNCVLTIPNLSNFKRKDIAVNVNGKGNVIDLQIPKYDPNENRCSKLRLNLRVYSPTRMDTFMDTCIEITIGSPIGLASIGDYKHTYKGFGDEGIACNSRATLVNIIQSMLNGDQLMRDISSIKCGDYYVESRKDNWLMASELKAKLIVYRKIK